MNEGVQDEDTEDTDRIPPDTAIALDREGASTIVDEIQVIEDITVENQEEKKKLDLGERRSLVGTIDRLREEARRSRRRLKRRIRATSSSRRE